MPFSGSFKQIIRVLIAVPAVRARLLSGCAIAMLAALPALAQQQPLTLDDCIRLAQGVPSAVTVARQEREIASRGVTQARAGFLPVPQINTGFNYNTLVNGQPSFVALNGAREYIAQGAITQEFDTSGRLRADLARANAEQNAATTSLAIAQRDLKRAVTTAYYRALLTERLAHVLEDVLKESGDFERRTRALFDDGEAAQADVVKASLQTSLWTASLRNAQAEATLARQQLAAFWTQDVNAPIVLKDVLEQPLPPEPASVPAPYLKRLEFNLFDAQKQSFDAQSRMARSALYPRFGVSLAYGIDAVTDLSKSRGFAALFNFTIPLFDWGKARSAATQFQLRGAQTQENRAIAQRAYSRDYENARTRVQSYQTQIQALEQQVRLATQNLELTRIRYQGGEGLALEVVTAQDTLAQTRASYYTNLANYWNAKADLEVASGQ